MTGRKRAAAYPLRVVGVLVTALVLTVGLMSPAEARGAGLVGGNFYCSDFSLIPGGSGEKLGAVSLADKGETLAVTITVRSGKPSTQYDYDVLFTAGDACIYVAGAESVPFTTNSKGYAKVETSVAIPSGAVKAAIVVDESSVSTRYVSTTPTRLR